MIHIMLRGEPNTIEVSSDWNTQPYPPPSTPLMRAGLDLESRLKNGLWCKKSTPLIGREVGTRLFEFTP